MQNPGGLFIVITGLDGSGISTIAKLLHERDPKSIKLHSISSVLSCREEIDSFIEESPWAHYLFYIATLQRLSDVVSSYIRQGYNVYMERYLIDTVVSHRVYGLEVELVYKTNFYNIIKPDLIFFLNVREEVRQERLSKRPKGKNKFDKKLDNELFRQRILKEFMRYRDHFIMIDNNYSPEQTLKKIYKIINEVANHVGNTA